MPSQWVESNDPCITNPEPLLSKKINYRNKMGGERVCVSDFPLDTSSDVTL